VCEVVTAEDRLGRLEVAQWHVRDVEESTVVAELAKLRYGHLGVEDNVDIYVRGVGQIVGVGLVDGRSGEVRAVVPVAGAGVPGYPVDRCRPCPSGVNRVTLCFPAAYAFRPRLPHKR
jgi:hypothetical protein